MKKASCFYLEVLSPYKQLSVYTVIYQYLILQRITSVLNGTVHWLRSTAKSEICFVGPTAAVPLGKRLSWSRMGCTALLLGLGGVFCLHCGDK